LDLLDKFATDFLFGEELELEVAGLFEGGHPTGDGCWIEEETFVGLQGGSLFGFFH
jgi:hypothetical protein